MVLSALVADDHPMCREAAKLALGAAGVAGTLHEAATLAEALAIDGRVDIVLLDLGLPDSKGIASLVEMRKVQPQAAILIVSGSEATGIEARAAAFGASGFVSKAAPMMEIVDAIRHVLGGGRAFPDDGPVPEEAAEADVARRLGLLTPAERRVLEAMAGGALNKQIAHELGLSEITVKQHVKAILRKLDVINRTQAVLALRAAYD